MICTQCNQEAPETKSKICDNCKKNASQRYNHIRANNNWIEIAEQAGLEIWERQPAENDTDYGIWSCYRDMYPGTKPTAQKVADTLGISRNVVDHTSKRWSFTMRMQAWVKHVDSELVSRRRNDIVEMNDKHMTMAKKLNEVLAIAIDQIDPMSLGPKDLNALMRTASELERKAKVDQYELTVAGSPVSLFEDDNPNLKKANVKSSDIGEIVKILAGAGALDNVGIRQTVTTEVVKKD